MKRKKIKIIILLIIIILFYLYNKKDYIITYNVNNKKITESYSNKFNYYKFSLNYKNKIYEYYLNKNHMISKKLIKKVKIESNNNYTCIKLISNKLKLNQLCYVNDIPVDKNTLMNNQKQKVSTISKIDNIEVKNYLNKNIYIWNYNGYTNINKNKKYNFLKTEIYNNKYTFISDRYLITPDYDQKYEFDIFHVIDMKKNKYKKITLPKKISYNFYYLGTYKNDIYIVDKKYKAEYKINIKKKSIINIIDKYNDGIIYNNKINKISINKLINNDYNFKYDTFISYKIKNNKLYKTYYKSKLDILITNKKVDQIIKSNNKEVIYRVKNKVYSYTDENKEKLMLVYNDLEFNSINQILIY